MIFKIILSIALLGTAFAGVVKRDTESNVSTINTTNATIEETTNSVNNELVVEPVAILLLNSDNTTTEDEGIQSDEAQNQPNQAENEISSASQPMTNRERVETNETQTTTSVPTSSKSNDLIAVESEVTEATVNTDITTTSSSPTTAAPLTTTMAKQQSSESETTTTE